MSSWSTEATTSTHDSLSSLNAQMEGRKRDTGGSGKLNFGGYDQSSSAGAGALIGGAIGSFVLPGAGTAIGAGIGGLVGSTQISGYDVVGIVGSEVQNMRTAVTDYVASIQMVVSEAITAAEDSLDTAIRGVDAQSAVIEYLAKVKLYVDNLISQLLSFSDKIADVGNAWITAQETIGSNIKTSTSNFSEGTAYTENVTYSGSTTPGSTANGVVSGSKPILDKIGPGPVGN